MEDVSQGMCPCSLDVAKANLDSQVLNHTLFLPV
jgi:hypothetical protein